jgi:cell division protein FtsI/penicillin-binding protein 2
MRHLIIGLALLLSSCAVSEGVDPDATTTSTVAPTSSIAVDESTRAAAIAVATQFYDAVLTGDGAAIAELGTDPPADLQEVLDRWAGAIGYSNGSFIVLRSTFGETSAEVTVRLTLDLVEVGPWSYETAVELVGGDESWATVWKPSALHPSLEAGDALRVDRSWLPRASILAADGTPIAGAEAVKIVGVVPARIDDLDSLTLELARLAGIDPAVVRTELANPVVQPDWFVPVGTVKSAVYATVGAELEALNGVLLRDGSARLPFRDDFASHLIGEVGPITAEQLEELGFPYGPTDTVGRGGLEERYEDQLAGRPRTAIVRVNRFGRVIEEVFTLDAREPVDLATTIDIEMQTAAEFALRDVTRPAAVVLLEASTGQVRALATRPIDDAFNRAILGTYPPGSTFKIITATALLAAGLTPSTDVACPTSVTLGGLSISNAGDFEIESASLLDAFAASCNTTFAELATARLSSQSLAAMAADFGFGTTPDLGVSSAESVFPVASDIAELASAAIGQGRIAVSPIHMASVAAAAATGVWRPPTVIAKATRSEGIAIDAEAIAALQSMTRAVITGGTGTTASVDGVIVHGKTGSAEFTDSANAPTHAWFVGYWDDLAIAVLVERAGGGGAVAAPIARRIIGDLTN